MKRYHPLLGIFFIAFGIMFGGSGISMTSSGVMSQPPAVWILTLGVGLVFIAAGVHVIFKRLRAS